MNTHVSFNVYGRNLDVLQQEAIAQLAQFSDSDTRWNINLDVTAQTTSTNGDIHWKGEVSAWLTADSGWRAGS